jgi:hypothetical protein
MIVDQDCKIKFIKAGGKRGIEDATKEVKEYEKIIEELL